MGNVPSERHTYVSELSIFKDEEIMLSAQSLQLINQICIEIVNDIDVSLY